MRVSNLKIEDFRSFSKPEAIQLSRITTFIGPNNAGKSSVLKALSALQSDFTPADIRIGAAKSKIQMTLSEVTDVQHFGVAADVESGLLDIEISVSERQITFQGPRPGPLHHLRPFPGREPHHFVVPYLSKRKTARYAEEVDEGNAATVASDFSNLAAKLSRLGNSGFPFHRQYDETCKAILGFTVTAIPSPNGQRPGVYLDDGGTLPMEQMGEGVPNIVGLLADLAQSRGKLFLIEEPENDLHPHALKALLDLIVESGEQNQMVVSTHSNIVARHLGAAAESALYYVDSDRGAMPPEAVVRPVDPTPSARLAVLRELGYSFSDFDLWDGWLILEESSAERIIRDYLIPWFAPKLSRIRTLSTAGNTGVEPTFDDFNRLIRFTHLEDAYRNSAWVLIDGDSTGQQIVENLRTRYPSWDADRFECLDETQFENYYPAVFTDQVDAALSLAGQQKREAKKALLEEVRQWLDSDEDRGRTALEKSARPVIEHLQRIERQLLA